MAHAIESFAAESVAAKRPAQLRDSNNKQFIATRFDRMCQCGHPASVHSAKQIVVEGRKMRECFCADFDESVEPCECELFKAAKKKAA
jgi:hypothetical protein